MATEEDKETRRLILNFYSAELNSHARLIIGASALFFTIMSVILEINKLLFLDIFSVRSERKTIRNPVIP